MKKLSLTTILFFVIVCLMHSHTMAQKSISGVVIDKSTGQPVEYANIGIEGTYLGAASNLKGEFRFSLPSSVKGAYIYASAVGYKTVQLLISELPKTENITIEMHPQTYGIQGVDISAQSLVLYRIIREAANKITTNYNSTPFSQKAYYKTKINSNNNFERNLEAVVEIYDASGYSHEKRDDEYKNRNYHFLEVRKDFTILSLSDGMTMMDELLGFDIVRSKGNILDNVFLRDYDLSLEQAIEYEGDSVWVINYSLENPDVSRTGDYYAISYQGKLYIKKDDYAVVKNETWVKSSDYSQHGRSMATVGEKEWKPLSIEYKFTVTYKRQGSIYNLAYIKSERTNKWEKIGEMNKVVSYESYLLPLGLETENPVPIQEREYFVNKPYNENFWRSFNIMVE